MVNEIPRNLMFLHELNDSNIWTNMNQLTHMNVSRLNYDKTYDTWLQTIWICWGGGGGGGGVFRKAYKLLNLDQL